jgi:hypothetical protein
MRFSIAVGVLMLSAVMLAAPAHSNGTSAMPSAQASNASQLPQLLSSLDATKAIRFDAVVSGTDGKTLVPPIGVTGEFIRPGEYQVSITKGGKITSAVVCTQKQSFAYSAVKNTYLDFSKHDSNPNGLLGDPGQFIQSQVGEYSGGSFFLALTSAISLKDLISAANIGDDLNWVHSEIADSTVMETETETATRTIPGEPGSSTLTFTINYTDNPISLTTVTFTNTGGKDQPASSFLITFNKYQLVSDQAAATDSDAIDAAMFFKTFCAGAKQWNAPAVP